MHRPKHRSFAFSLGLTLTLSMSVGCEQEVGSPPASAGAAEADADHGVSYHQEGEALADLLQVDAEGWRVAPPIAAHGAVFNRAGLRFDANAPVDAELRTSTDGSESWGAWTSTVRVFEENGAHNALLDIDEAGVSHVQVRFRAPVEADITFLAVELFDLAGDAAGRETTLDLGQSDDEQTLSSDLVVPGSSWGRRAGTGSCGSAHSPSRLTIHHTVTPKNDTMSMPTRIRQMESFHVDVRGWCGIGYHVLIGQDGLAYEGRSEGRTGAHAAGANTNNLGISFIGDYSSQLPSEIMLQRAATVMRALSSQYGIALNRNKVKGHRQVGNTSTACPGGALYNYLDTLVAQAADADAPIVIPDETAPPPEPECSSSTLGHLVDSGTCVQVAYAGCGMSECGWYRCAAGQWQCTDPVACDEDMHPHAVCPDAQPAPEPEPQPQPEPQPEPEPEPVDGDCPAGVHCVATFPYVAVGDTTGAGSEMDGYSCAPNVDESGPERVYRLSIPTSGTLEVSLDDTVGGWDVDIDVHVLSALDADACLARGHTDASAHVDAGVVYVVLDSWVSQWGTAYDGPYEALFTFTPDDPSWTPDPVDEPVDDEPVDDEPVDDEPADDEPVSGDCPAGVTCVAAFPGTYSGTTSGGASELNGYSCAPGLNEGGPERVFRVTLPEDGYLNVALDMDVGGASTDIDVHILSDLDAGACVDRGHWSAGAYLPAGDAWVVLDSYVNSSGDVRDGEFEVTFSFSAANVLVAHGVPTHVADAALNAYSTATAEGYADTDILTVIDFTTPSDERRLWTVDMATGELLFHLHVSHGIGSNHPSNAALATSFSNTSGSHQSSLGLMRTAETYYGSHGLSLRLDGLEPANSNVRSRAIVVHGAYYAEASFANQNGYLGRSHGCPAVGDSVSSSLINTIKEGTLMFSYGDDDSWLATSPFLP
jgi:hypothetical protein